MSKYEFNRANDDTLNVRMDKDTAKSIRQIAKDQATTVQEVCRVFLREALKDYLTPQPKESDKVKEN